MSQNTIPFTGEPYKVLLERVLDTLVDLYLYMANERKLSDSNKSAMKEKAKVEVKKILRSELSLRIGHEKATEVMNNIDDKLRSGRTPKDDGYTAFE